MMTTELDLEDEEDALAGGGTITTTTTAAERDAPAFDFYCERWTHGTRHLTKVERCDYLDLLLHQWTNDGLPADLDMLARLVGYRKGSQIPPLVLEKFPIAADGKRRNARLEHERVKQRDRIRRKRQGAAITNAKREARKAASTASASGQAAPSGRQQKAHSDTLSDTLSATLSDTDSVTLSERIACAERDDIVTPPPTTHHPPHDLQFSLSHPPEGSGWPGSEEQCRSMAVSNGVDPDYAATIWNLHESSGDYTQKDMHGNSRPILKFSNYLKFRWNCRTRRVDDAKALEKTKAELRRQPMVNGNGHSAAPRSSGGGTNVNANRNERVHGSGSKPVPADRGQRSGEIQTDVHVNKVKIYRLEDCEHE
jgi:uncharacterized protein YdaU (DUF1376 family)